MFVIFLYIFELLLLWMTIAHFRGAIHFSYPPLVFEGIGTFFIAVGMIMPLFFSINMAVASMGILTAIGTGFNVIYMHKYLAGAKRRKITARRLYFFQE